MSSLQCVNCNVRLNRIRRHILTNESDIVVNNIRMWTYPREITASDHICHACWELASHEAFPDNVPTRQVGHHHVCVICGRSILRISRRRILIEGSTEEQQRITDIISNWIQPRQLTSEDEACVPCWLRAQRASQRTGPPQEDQPTNSPDLYYSNNEIIDKTCCLCGNDLGSNMMRPQPPTVERQHISQLIENRQIPSTNEVCPACWEQVQGNLHTQGNVNKKELGTQSNVNESVVNDPSFITLRNIRRAAETPRHCIFQGCLGIERHIVPDDTRRRVLLQFCYFIPRGARICSQHLNEEQYENLYTAEYSLDTFNSRYIEEIVFTLMEGLPNVSYENIQNYPEHQVKYFIGLTKRQQTDIRCNTAVPQTAVGYRLRIVSPHLFPWVP